jgi:hypothetical protein
MSTSRAVGDWIHAHEHDHDDVRVFVNAAQPLPPSRGRQRLSLRADGTFEDFRPGADDRTRSSSGTYQFDGKKLILRHHDSRALTIYETTPSTDGSRLELKTPQ